MEAKIKYEGFRKKFQKTWFQPLVDTNIAMVWQKLPQQAKDQLKAKNPAEYDNMEKHYGNSIRR